MNIKQKVNTLAEGFTANRFISLSKDEVIDCSRISYIKKYGGKLTYWDELQVLAPTSYVIVVDGQKVNVTDEQGILILKKLNIEP